MDYGALIGEFVRTYDLPQKLESRLVRIAERRVHELNLNSVAKVYNYVDYLVGRFTRSREDISEEILTFSLDDKIKHKNSETSFHEVIGTQDPNLAIYTQRVYQQQEPPNPNSPTEPISPTEVLNVLRGNLSELDFSILSQMINMGANIFNSSDEGLLLSKDAIISRIPQIQERLETLTRAYERDGRIVIPRRPIVYVRFDPVFHIKFGRRRYNGNPLAVMEANRDIYDGKSKRELNLFDRPLYEALGYHNQMDIAFPKISLSQFEVDRILDSMASHRTYIHMVEDKKFGLIGRVLNWNAMYGQQGVQDSVIITEPKFVIIKPGGIRPIGFPQTFPFCSDDELHLLAGSLYPYGSFKRFFKERPRIANGFKKIAEFQDVDGRMINVQFYEIPEGHLARFPEVRNPNQQNKAEETRSVPIN